MMENTILFAVLILFTGCLGQSAQPQGPAGTGPECSIPCKEWQECIQGQCVSMQGRCFDFTECEPWQSCEEHTCVLAEGFCGDNGDCEEWQHCDERHECAAKEGFCDTNGDCQNPMVCMDHVCEYLHECADLLPLHAESITDTNEASACFEQRGEYLDCVYFMIERGRDEEKQNLGNSARRFFSAGLKCVNEMKREGIDDQLPDGAAEDINCYFNFYETGAPYGVTAEEMDAVLDELKQAALAQHT
jgi:hypothetical protein